MTASMVEVSPSLLEQLKDGGRIVVPIGRTEKEQKLVLLEKSKNGLNREFLSYCSFVPCVG